MQLRRFAALLIGAWLAGSVFMDTAAIGNFRAVSRFLADPGIAPAELLHEVGRDRARILLRRVAGESNAYLFEQWEWAQLAIGLSLVLVLVFGNRPAKLSLLLALLMLAIVLTDRFLLTPNIARLGRIIDFLPPDPTLPQRHSFGIYHGVSSSLELVKLALGLGIAGLLVIRRRPDPKLFAREAEVAAYSAPQQKSR